jgi:hypothetical protein
MNYGLEHARAAQRALRRTAERRYAGAVAAPTQHKAQFLALGEQDAPAALA